MASGKATNVPLIKEGLICIYSFPGGIMVKNQLASAKDAGSISGSGRSPGGGNGAPLQYSSWDNPMGREAWQVTVHGVAKLWT